MHFLHLPSHPPARTCSIFEQNMAVSYVLSRTIEHKILYNNKGLESSQRIYGRTKHMNPLIFRTHLGTEEIFVSHFLIIVYSNCTREDSLHLLNCESTFWSVFFLYMQPESTFSGHPPSTWLCTPTWASTWRCSSHQSCNCILLLSRLTRRKCVVINNPCSENLNNTLIIYNIYCFMTVIFWYLFELTQSYNIVPKWNVHDCFETTRFFLSVN